jgi:NAD(P)H-quinone oxidoreductase subunit K
MKLVEPILTGKYMQSDARFTPPKELTEGMGMAVPPALLTSQKQKEATERG